LRSTLFSRRERGRPTARRRACAGTHPDGAAALVARTPYVVAGSLRRVLPAVPSTVTALRAEVAAFVVAAGIGEPLLTGVKLAVSEAVTNAVVHAYVDAERPGEVRLMACLREDYVHVTVSDDGCGMMPRLDSPGLGVGLPFIAHTADTLDIDHSDGGGTELRMSFRIAVAVDRS
jgi:anti-sigma regulatory factor (Ser/Thr protein kinase)